MRLTIIGTGYVGLVTGTCFAEAGHTVICVDKDEKKVEVLRKGGMPIYEPDREKVIFDNIRQENQGPLSDVQLRMVYERLVDVMRQIQREEMAPEPPSGDEATGLEPND